MIFRFFLTVSIVLCSQVFFLGAFAVSEGFIVLRESDKMCGNFIPGNVTSPNWLTEGWYALGLNTELAKNFRVTPSCEAGDLARCCRDNDYRYAGVPIGEASVTELRKAAEYLASKSIIERNNLQPSEYRLSESITRREMMKIISEVASLPETNCKRSFTDVIDNDWGCPYVEAALARGFITKNDAFRPNDTLTQTEALKLIFEARGIEKRYNTRFWQQDYISSAVYLGYIDEKYADYNISSTRGWIFQVLARTYGNDFRAW